jgi:Tol biopolymer transport system component
VVPDTLRSQSLHSVTKEVGESKGVLVRIQPGRSAIGRTASGRAVTALLAGSVALLLATPAVAGATPGPAGAVQGDGSSFASSISADGQAVAFTSTSSNLVPGDTNDTYDAFVRGWPCGITRRVSVSSTGEQGDRPTTGIPQLSADGRYVAFASLASNLVPQDTNNAADLFWRDLSAGVTRRVDLGASGGQQDGGVLGYSMSANGGFVAFVTPASLVPGDTNGNYDVYLRDVWHGTTRRVSVSSTGAEANAGSFAGPAISADGRFVAFGSYASNLVAGDSNDVSDVFLRDTWQGTTRRISLSASGAQADGEVSGSLAITPDGRFVAFGSYASNLVPADTNGRPDVFLRDILHGSTERVNVSTAGAQSTGQPYNAPSVSADGHLVGFVAMAADLVPGGGPGGDTYVRDLRRHTTERLSVTADGEPADGVSDYVGAPFLSAGGRYATFASTASNLVPADTNDGADVFLRDRHAATTQLISLGDPTG